MGKLNFDQMEKVKGGASCFFAVPFIALSLCTPIFYLWDMSIDFAIYCWNS